MDYSKPSPVFTESTIAKRSVWWEFKDGKKIIGQGCLNLINQPLLPSKLEVFTCTTYEETAFAIRTMIVRGAPAIGVAGAYGMVLAAQSCFKQNPETVTQDDLRNILCTAKKCLDSARPTAVNLTWATSIMLRLAKSLKHSLTAEDFVTCLYKKAEELANDDIQINRRMYLIKFNFNFFFYMGELGASVVPNGANILHHCNTGALATVDVGTALGVIYTCHEQGKSPHVCLIFFQI
eukprot:GSMAST32.ASY1.ANO1.1392.1 assembled CDS